MKKLLFLGTLLFAFVCTTFAQTDNQPAPANTTELKQGKGRGQGQAQGNNIKKALNLRLIIQNPWPPIMDPGN